MENRAGGVQKKKEIRNRVERGGGCWKEWGGGKAGRRFRKSLGHSIWRYISSTMF